VTSFAGAYWSLTNVPWLAHAVSVHSSTLQWYEALVLSLSSFYGRGFCPPTLNLGDPVAIVAACEAVAALFIELILIATFNRRFLGN
jgi:hypothetical protein